MGTTFPTSTRTASLSQPYLLLSVTLHLSIQTNLLDLHYFQQPEFAAVRKQSDVRLCLLYLVNLLLRLKVSLAQTQPLCQDHSKCRGYSF